MPMRYWSEEDLGAVNGAKSFMELGEISIDVASKIPAEVVSQLCGPMTTGGYGFRNNMFIFERAIQIMLSRGYVVFNQLPLQAAMIRLIKELEIKGYPQAIIDDVYIPLFSSGYIKQGCFLPRWKTSHGTRQERAFLESIGLDIFDIPADWIVVEVSGSL